MVLIILQKPSMDGARDDNNIRQKIRTGAEGRKIHPYTPAGAADKISNKINYFKDLFIDFECKVSGWGESESSLLVTRLAMGGPADDFKG